MELPLRIALIVITAIYLFFVLKSIKDKKIQISFSSIWLFTGLALVIALIIPNSVQRFSNFLGFKVSVNMIFCIANFICFYMILNLNMLLTKENKKNVALVQEISILKKKVEELENNAKTRN